MIFFTVGHSTRELEDLTRLLRVHAIEALADIRSFPGSRRYPWFDREALQPYLAERGIGYVHVARLGGRRPAQRAVDPTANAAWTNPSFRNYADYSLTPEFEEGLAQLIELARERRTAYMCSESVPWRCHRLLVSNTLVARGHDVYHLLSETTVEKHALGKWGAPARCEGGVVTYPNVTG